MKSLIVYNSSGEILRSVMVDDGTSQIIDPANEFEIEADIPDDIENYVVNNGALVLKPQSEIDAIKSNYDWQMLRMTRDQMLAASDWTQVPDAPVDQAAWATYRQALRDLPENTTDPANPIWPSKPS